MNTTTSTTTRTSAREPRRTRQLAALLFGAALSLGVVAVPSTVLATEEPPHDSIAAGSGMTDDEYDAAMARLADKHPWAFEEDVPAGRVASLSWGHELARVVFDKAFDLGFDAVLDAVFGNSTASALADISDSLDDIKVRMESIELAIQQLAENVDKTAFIAAEGWAKDAASDIRSQFKLIEGWESGHAFDDQDVRDLAGVSYTAVEKLETHLLGPYGSQAQLFTLLGHADRDEAWEEYSAYREGYRASLATGLMNLIWAAEYDARYLNHLETARATADRTADALFDIGLGGSYAPSLDSRFFTPSGQPVEVDHFNNRSNPPISFDVSDTLPTVLTQRGPIRMVQEDPWNHWPRISPYRVELFDTELTVDLFTGEVHGTAHGTIRHDLHGGPTFRWTFTAPITGQIDLAGDGRMSLYIPFHELTNAYNHAPPFSAATLILDPV